MGNAVEKVEDRQSLYDRYNEVMGGLNRRQKLYVEYYVGKARFNSAKAARLAGYAETTQDNSTGVLLGRPDIREAIDLRLKLFTMSADEAAYRISDIAAGTMSPFLRQTAAGEMTVDLTTKEARDHMHLLKEVDIREVKSETESCECGEGGTTHRVLKTKIKLHDAKDAMVQIAKMAGRYGDRPNGGGDVNVTQTVVQYNVPDNERARKEAIPTVEAEEVTDD